MLAGLAGGEMPAGAGALGPRQRRLDHQQVGFSGQLDQRVVGPAVGAVGEARAVTGQICGERGREVRDLLQADGERPDLELVRRGQTYLSYTLVLDDNWPSRRTAERLGAYVCANYMVYRRVLGGRGQR